MTKRIHEWRTEAKGSDKLVKVECPACHAEQLCERDDTVGHVQRYECGCGRAAVHVHWPLLDKGYISETKADQRCRACGGELVNVGPYAKLCNTCRPLARQRIRAAVKKRLRQKREAEA